MSFPTIDQVIAHLNESGQPAMALAVEWLADSEKRCRKAMHDNLKAFYALKDKYEPRPKREPYVTWTGD